MWLRTLACEARVPNTARLRCIAVIASLCLSACGPILAQNSGRAADKLNSLATPSLVELDVNFTPQMQVALASGVPLSIELDFVYITPRILLENHSLLTRHEFKLERHALSNRFMVSHNNAARPELFATLIGLNDYLSAESLRLFAKYIKEHQPSVTSNSSVPHLRLALDKFKLPGPVRLSAFVSNQWEFDTGWITWDLEN